MKIRCALKVIIRKTDVREFFANYGEVVTFVEFSLQVLLINLRFIGFLGQFYAMQWERGVLFAKSL